MDGITFAAIEASGLQEWLAGLREELISKTYRPDPVRRVMIPKPNGAGERPLGIPTIRDRVIQTAAKIVLEPFFEVDFEDNAYGYRPARGAVDAVKEVHRLICRGYTDVVDADLSRYFDSIPHDELLNQWLGALWIGDVLRLIKLWLKAPIEERDNGDGTRRIGWWQEQQPRHASRRRREPDACQHLHEPVPEVLAADRTRGSVLCARRRVCRRLRHSQPRTCGGGSGVDESGDDAARAHRQRGQDLVDECSARTLRLPWLLVRTSPLKANGLWYLSASPSKKSVQQFKTKVGNLLVPGNNDPWPEVRDTLNRSLLGWSNYFCHGTCRSAFRGVDQYVYERVRDFLARRHKMAGRGTKRFSRDVVYGERGLLRLERLPLTAPSCAMG